MKVDLNLSHDEICEAIAEYVTKKTGVTIFGRSLRLEARHTVNPFSKFKNAEVRLQCSPYAFDGVSW